MAVYVYTIFLLNTSAQLNGQTENSQEKGQSYKKTSTLIFCTLFKMHTDRNKSTAQKLKNKISKMCWAERPRSVISTNWKVKAGRAQV